MIFLTVSVLALSFPGCGKKENTSDRTLRVGIVTYTQDDPFINTMTEQIREDLKLKESKDIKILVSVKNGDNDQRDQDELVEEIKSLKIVLDGKDIFPTAAKDTVLRIISEQPTAYDPDKVVEQLEERTAFLKDCTKYGNKAADQQSKSYDTMMMYEVMDLVDDLLEIVKAGVSDGN